MGRRAATATSAKKRSRVPMTPEDREQYLINLSLDAAEKQLREEHSLITGHYAFLKTRFFKRAAGTGQAQRRN